MLSGNSSGLRDLRQRLSTFGAGGFDVIAELQREGRKEGRKAGWLAGWRKVGSKKKREEGGVRTTFWRLMV